jgi:hypothetical protein
VQQRIIRIAAIALGRRIDTPPPVFYVLQQLQGIVGMQALIVVQRLISQCPEAQDRPKQDHAPERNPEK